MSSYAKRMMHLFGGLRSAHGTHGDMKSNPDKDGKLEIKDTARTLREPVTVELWQRHLDGEYYLGIIPVDEEGMSVFGCIDVDYYDINLGETVTQLKKRKLPMVVCRSKSGGAHVFMFLKSPTPTANFRARLRQIAASMGWGDCEIFPKQNKILIDRGDFGNWLNMPYHNMSKPDRYGVKETMAAMSISEFLNLAERTLVDPEQMPEVTDPEDNSIDDGPPCLQHMCKIGFPSGQGNNGFFGLATFCKKKYGSKWKEVLEEYNRRFFTPPRPADEVADTIKRVENKDYNYRCKDQPFVSYCNAALCRARKFGIGGSGQYPVVTGLSKVDTDPVLWFMDIDDRRIQLTTKQLRDYREFQLVCMDKLTVMFMPMKLDTWAQMISEAMASAIIIEAPPEMSITGHFMELLEAFCTDRHRGTCREDLWLGKPFLDEETNRHYFRLMDFTAFLEREKFRYWGRNEVGQYIREQIGGKHFFNVKHYGGVNVFWVSDNFREIPDIPLPEIKEDPL